jgi:uncharacterized protein (DUF1778 family)
MMHLFLRATATFVDVLRIVRPLPRANVPRHEQVSLSERDSLRVVELLENPPAAPDRLVRAAKADFTLR